MRELRDMCLDAECLTHAILDTNGTANRFSASVH